LDFEAWTGLLGTVILGNIISAWWIYAMIWTETRQRQGMPESAVPWPIWIALIAAPAISAGCLWVALY
jgi:hypothetical protein